MLERPMMLVVCLLANAVFAQPPLPPLDMAPAADLSPAIEWREDWRQSLAHNLTRWRDELEAESDKTLRERRLDARQAALLLAAREKWPEAADDPALTFALAARLGEIGAAAHRVRELRRLIEARPGDFATAAAALTEILDLRIEDALVLPEGTVEDALDRLTRLEQGGQLQPGDPAPGQGLLLLAALRHAQGRPAEAAAALREAEARLGRTTPLLWQEARLATDLGLTDEARDAYQEIVHVAADPRESARAQAEMDRQLNTLTGPGPLPTVMTDQALLSRFETMQAQDEPPDAAAVAAILDHPDVADALVGTGGMRYRSLWSALIDSLERRFPDPATPLAMTREPAADEVAHFASDEAALLRAFRRFPWSEAVHRAMLAAGERALWRGAHGAALRWFEDVAARATLPALRAHGQVGTWLALSQLQDPAALEAALQRGMDPSKDYPWQGGTIRGSELAEQLRRAATATPPAPHPEQPRVLQLPAAELWAPVVAGRASDAVRRDATVHPWPTIAPDGTAFVAGPSFVAAFAPGEVTATWARIDPMLTGFPEETDVPITPPTPMRAAVAGGVVIVRGAPRPDTGAPTALGGLDARSGAPLWSSRGAAEWDGLVPVSDATIAHGVGYVVAINEGVLATAHVVAFTPATGDVRWIRPLAAQATSIAIGSHRTLDVARYGNPPTVAGGAVYVSTNLGCVARLDCRDGAIDWMTLYARTAATSQGLPLVRRRGAAPVVIGEHVIIAARDRQGVFALDAATGGSKWHAPTAPSIGVAGRAGGLAIVFDDHAIAAIDPANGEALWWRHAGAAWQSPPRVHDGVIAIPEGPSIVHIDAPTGLDLEQHPLGFGGYANIALDGGSIAAVAAGAEGTVADVSGRIEIDSRVRLLRRSPAVLFMPALGADAPMLVRSAGLLEAVDVAAGGVVRWRRRMPAGGIFAGFGDRLVLCDGDRVEAVNLDDGETLWRQAFAGPITHVAADAAGIAVASFNDDAQAPPLLALLDPATGQARWQRPLMEDGRRLRLAGLGFHEGGLHAVAWHDHSRNPPRRVALDPGTGRVLVSAALSDAESRAVSAMGIHAGHAWAVLNNGGLDLTPLADAATGTPRSVKLEGFNQRFPLGAWVDPSHDWLCLSKRWWDWRIRGNREAAWLIPLTAPEHAIAVSNSDFASVGEGLVAISDGVTSGYTLPDMNPTPAFEPPETRGDRKPLAVAAAPDGSRVAVLSEVTVPASQSYAHAGLVIDVFDSHGAHHLGRAWLDELAIGDTWGSIEQAGAPAREGRLLWYGDTLVVTGPNSVEFLPVPTSPADEPAGTMVPYLTEPVVLDGDLEEWRDIPAVTASDPRGGATLRMAHDGKRLLIAVTHAQAAVRPLLGAGWGAAGSWLELGSAPHRWGDWRCGVGLDAQGDPLWFGLDQDGVPADVEAAIRLDPEAHELHYEIAIPLYSVTRGQKDRWLEAGFSIVAWQEGRDPAVQKRTVWGGGLERPTMNTLSLRTIRLAPTK